MQLEQRERESSSINNFSPNQKIISLKKINLKFTFISKFSLFNVINKATSLSSWELLFTMNTFDINEPTILMFRVKSFTTNC